MSKRQNSSSLTFPWHGLHPRYWPTWLLIAGMALLARVPWQIRWWLGCQLGKVLYRHHQKRTKIVQTNIRLCFSKLTPSEQERIVLQHLQHYAAALLDYSVLFFQSRQTIQKRVKLHLPDSFHQAYQTQQPIIILLGHSTWLEFAPLALGLEYAAYGSYKPFNNPVLDWFITRSRLKDVKFVISRDEGLLRLVRQLTAQQLLIFLPDEDLGLNASVFAPFMGQTKATLTTPARIAQISQAQCFVTLAFFNEHSGMYEIKLTEALPDYPSRNALTDARTLNVALESLILLYPAQYLWLMKLFKTQPDKKRWY